MEKGNTADQKKRKKNTKKNNLLQQGILDCLFSLHANCSTQQFQAKYNKAAQTPVANTETSGNTRRPSPHVVSGLNGNLVKIVH